MALQIITKITCDFHALKEEPEEVDAGTIQIILPNGQIREIDLCDGCQSTIVYKHLIELAQSDVARDAEEQEQPSPRRKKSRPSKSTSDLPEDFYCTADNCDRAFTSEQGVLMHLRRAHPDDQEARKKQIERTGGDIIVCEKCEPPGLFSSAESLTQHNRTFHAEDDQPADTGTRITSTDAIPMPHGAEV